MLNGNIWLAKIWRLAQNQIEPCHCFEKQSVLVLNTDSFEKESVLVLNTDSFEKQSVLVLNTDVLKTVSVEPNTDCF